MIWAKPQIDREASMKLWADEHSDYAKEQVVLNNIGIVGITIKSLNLNLFDEDLFSTGIVGLVNAVNTFDIGKDIKFSTYAARVVRNEILRTFRKKRINPAFSLDESFGLDNGDEIFYEDVIADKRGFEEEVVAYAHAKQVFSRLSEREKKVITLSMRGKTQAEIAEACGVSQSYVSRIIKSVYKKWRE